MTLHCEYVDVGQVEKRARRRATSMGHVEAFEDGWSKHPHPGGLGLYPTPVTRTRRYRLPTLLWEEPTIGTTVRSVAHRRGFPDLGKFTVDYRLQHGEDPSSTLRR
ncbi:hypothetical protein GCM10011374_24050 [Kocuria dechangensis]|uniref:HTH araC/xylS-type domain-containing protein n=1 Tax=Kocuria dechangensis TaxID=1176249 RepID=A0A917GXQ2_9MICC|nr:hypothetical protein GCM10011374_24050 [Kocuria dechangensis]